MMKRNIRGLRLTVLAVFVATAVLISPTPAMAGGLKIEICHKEGTPAEKTLHVSAAAFFGHVLVHGDSVGECGGGGGGIIFD